MPVFGYVPSRRLGRSLGVNNVEAKRCSYSCVYCQLGRTDKLTIKRTAFYDPDELVREVRERLERVGEVDYVTFVASGEPTLDANLGRELEMLEDVRTAVITNASLLFMPDVREDLIHADLVSLKIDAVSEDVWRAVNRPHPQLKLDRILSGVLEFSDDFAGRLITETMLIEGYNLHDVAAIAEFLGELRPDIAYIAVPTRPTAEKVRGAGIEAIMRARRLFECYTKCELLVEEERGEFAVESVEELKKVAAVHPVREDVVGELENDDFEVLIFEGKKYYRVRRTR